MWDIRKKERRRIMLWLAAATFCVFFSMAYNHYGHGIHSFFMSDLFLWPLAGAVWYLLLPAVFSVHPRRLSVNAMNAGIATITVGSLLRGIFEIAGTASPYVILFFCMGSLLCLLGILFLLWHKTDNLRPAGPAQF